MKKLLIIILIGAFSNCIFGQSDPSSLPAAFNWRDLGKMTSVKEQGNCGSCVSHSVIGVLESLIKIHFNEFPGDVNHPDLSEQHLIDKSWEMSSNGSGWGSLKGCSGGSNMDGFEMIKALGGVYSEECYPSFRVQGTYSNPRGCELNYPGIVYYIEEITMAGFGWSISLAEFYNEIKNSIYTNGPIAVGIYASNSFKAFMGKTENDVFIADQSPLTPNHSIIICGWDDNKGTLLSSGKHKGAWLIKNSNGTSWGSNGYAWVEFNDEMIKYFQPTLCILKNTTANTRLNTNKSSQIGGYVRAANEIILEPGFEFTPTPSNPAIPIPASINGYGSYNAYQNPNSFLSINTIQLDAVPLRAPKAFYGFDGGRDKDKEDNSNQLKEQVFPNPTHGEFTVRMNLPEHQTSEIRVYDSMGKLVKTVVASATETLVSIEDQPAGIYFVRYTVDGKDQSAKVVKL